MIALIAHTKRAQTLLSLGMFACKVSHSTQVVTLLRNTLMIALLLLGSCVGVVVATGSETLLAGMIRKGEWPPASAVGEEQRSR